MKETTIRCDRCGKTYSLDQWPEVEFHGKDQTQLEMKAITGVVGGIVQTADVDLCLNCRREFREWFERKATR